MNAQATASQCNLTNLMNYYPKPMILDAAEHLLSSNFSINGHWCMN